MPSRSPLRSTGLRPVFAVVMLTAVHACATSGSVKGKSSSERHVAHGHAIATIEKGDGESEMLERVEDEDTQWVELPHFGECPYDADEIPPYKKVDDGSVPGLDPKRTRLTNMDAGDETIHNEALLQRLNRATTVVLECVSVSACYDTQPVEPGSIDLNFELAPNGDVRGVDVETSPELNRKGIRPCARRAIWDTKFPAFDGADMVVSYRLDID